jgi:hypothetical protein
LYNNLPQSQTPYYQQQYVGGYNGYYNSTAYPNKPIQMEQQVPTYLTPSPNYIKGRPVVSIDEARASQIDLDGSLYVFTDIGNKKIYTKQINIDGTATLNTYSLIEDEVAAPPPAYVTKAEFNQALAQIQAMFMSREKEDDKKAAASNF